MSEQLAYALITPYSLYKSRTGGIIGRILANSKLEFVGARMFVFSQSFIDAYKEVICPPEMPEDFRQLWRDYIDVNFRKENPYNAMPRAMFLLFRGPNAVRRLKEEVIGPVTEQPIGYTVRGTFGDMLRNPDGSVRYFEPAVITCPHPELNDQHLKLFADYAISDGGLMNGKIQYEEGEGDVECSLVLIKPDNFYRPSRRPGNIIDTFSLTGLRIVGAKLFNMTVAQGEEFYGPLKDIFVKKLRFLVTREVYSRLHDAFDFAFREEDAEVLTDHLAERNARCEFSMIVEYMTGVNPETIDDPSEKQSASRTKCLALLYEGRNAISKIRTVLGSTDPSKAEPDTVRSDFGRDLMRNGAHASDSPDNAIRERKIVDMYEQETNVTDIGRLINDYLQQHA
ncbi:MAG: nucleoside-diphosphate kinase [Planctomycetota bacterium]